MYTLTRGLRTPRLFCQSYPGSLVNRSMIMLALASMLTGQNLPDSVTTNTFANPLYEESNTESRKVAIMRANKTVAVHHIFKSGNDFWVRVYTGGRTGWLTIDDLSPRSRIDVRNYAIAVLKGHEVAETDSAAMAADNQVQVIRFESSSRVGFLEDFLSVGLVPAIVVMIGLIGWIVLRRR